MYAMSHQVRGAYKRLLLALKHYPLPETESRARLRRAFLEHKTLRDSLEVDNAVRRADEVVKQILAIARFHRYRTLKRRYGEHPK